MTQQSIIDKAFDALQAATSETDKIAGQCEGLVGDLTTRQVTGSVARIQTAANMQILVRNFLTAELRRIEALRNMNLLVMPPGGHA